MLISTCIILALANVAQSASSASTEQTEAPSGDSQEIGNESPGPKTYDCMNCIDLGRTCTGPVVNNCEYCAKVTGALRNLAKLPDWAAKYIQNIYTNITISDYKDKLVTLKTCVSSNFVEMIGFIPQRGCKPFTRYGFYGRGCLCRGECPKPKHNRGRTFPTTIPSTLVSSSFA